LIVYDPRKAADKTRGTVSEHLVEAIDLAPTFLDLFGVKARPHIMEGRSLKPLLHGEKTDWRDFCISEYDYSTREARREIGVDQADARMVMVFDGRWKYIHSETLRPMLFDLKTDPCELTDLAQDPAYASELERLTKLHFEWSRRHHNRITLSAETIEKMADGKEPPGIMIGFADKEELEAVGKKVPDHVVR